MECLIYRERLILVFGDMQLIVLDAQTGSILIKLDFQDQVARPRFLLNDFDKDGCKEAVIWIYGDDYLHIYKFHRKDNFFHADEINTIDATEYQIGAFYPGLAFADTNNDSFDELILIRHGGVSIYNAKAFLSEEEKGLDPISRVDYIPEGADNGRFYGYFTMQDVTGDDIPDGVIVADGVSMHVGMMEGGVNNIKKILGSLLWIFRED